MDIASHAAFDLQLFVSTSVFGRLLQQMDRWGNYTEAQAAHAAKVRTPCPLLPCPTAQHGPPQNAQNVSGLIRGCLWQVDPTWSHREYLRRRDANGDFDFLKTESGEWRPAGDPHAMGTLGSVRTTNAHSLTILTLFFAFESSL